MSSSIQAITFDLWDTLVHDDSDEPRRAAAGLRRKHDERRFLLWDALNRHAPLPEHEVRTAYDTTDAAFNTVWHQQHVTWPIRTRLEVVLRGLKRTLPEDDLERVVHAHEQMEVEIAPDVIDGCRDALEALASRYKLAIVSDAIVTPGRGLRDVLRQHGLYDFFGAFAFSDEVGHSKPHRSMFDAVAETLDVELAEMVHIGDREHNDIKGPHRLGMKAILFTASRDVDREGTTADAVCASYAELPGIIDAVVAG